MRNRARQLLFLFWVLPAFVAAYGMHVVSVRYNPDLTFVEKLGAQFLMWMSWGVWTWIIFAICDRVPFTKGGIARAFAVLVPLSVVVTLVQIFQAAWVTRLYALGPGYPFTSTIAVGVRSYGDVFVIIFWAIVGAHAAMRWYEAWQAEQVRAAQLSADLSAAQLRALQAQLNPHFLFNALNSVVTLIDKEPAAAQGMIVRLADLLRSTLALSSEQETSLEQEIQLTAHYLEIEQIRFNDRLTVRWEVDPMTRGAAVPSLVLQPLVENAIVHGTSQLKGAGEIAIGASLSGSALVVTVRDNGPGLNAPTTSRRSTGIGVANLRERLNRLYGAAATLSLGDVGKPGDGCLVTITLPFRTTA